MAATGESCPGPAEIERLASGQGVSPEIARHVDACQACATRLRSARDDIPFLTRVRTLVAPGLGPEGAPRIPGYRPLGVISSGAQGVVYRAVQESTSRTVAIKTLMAGEAASNRQRVRAEREAEIAARLRHPNIVTVFESRTLSDGRIAVVMEFIDGVPLDAWVPPGRTDAERQRERLRVFLAVCHAIHHAHLNGVIHRDLKPDNILVTADGRPVVLDFGVAKAGGLHTTVTGEFAGTPAFASPEQVAGRPENVDALTDVYSLGVILYRILCGALPYDVSGSIFDIARTIGQTPPTPPRQRDPAMSADLEAIVLRAMEKEKDRRYQSAAGLARDLERYLAGDPVEARSGSGWYLLRKAVQLNRRRLSWSAAGLVLLLAAGVAVALSVASAAESAKLAGRRDEEARAENARARAVTELLRETLPNADPDHPELDAIIGAGLGRLYFRLETGAFADDPEVDQVLRRLWGSIYTGLGSGKAAGLVEYAEASLRSGLVRLRQQHGDEHPQIAATMHELAGVLLVRKRAPEAERTCRPALAMRARLLGASSAPAAESRALLARILLALGRPDEAAVEADTALVILRTLPEPGADRAIASMTDLQARVHLEAANPQAAEAPMRESLLRRVRHLPPEDPDLLASLGAAAELAALRPDGELAGVLRIAWGSRPGELAADLRRDVGLLGSADKGTFERPIHTGRAAALGRLLRLEEALLGPSDPALVRILIAQMRAAEGERLLDLKAGAALRAADILSQRFGPDDPFVQVCIDEAALVLAYIGRPDQAVELARRSCRIDQALPAAARDPLSVTNSRRYLAWFLSLADRDAEAIREYQSVIEEFRGIVGPGHHLVAMSRSGLAFCIAQTGDLRQADDLSRDAIESAQRLTTIHEDQMDQIRFVRGHILRTIGRDAEARPLLEKAWNPTLKYSGLQFKWRRMLVEDAAGACEALGDRPAADAWRAQIDKYPDD